MYFLQKVDLLFIEAKPSLQNGLTYITIGLAWLKLIVAPLSGVITFFSGKNIRFHECISITTDKNMLCVFYSGVKNLQFEFVNCL